MSCHKVIYRFILPVIQLAYKPHELVPRKSVNWWVRGGEHDRS